MRPKNGPHPHRKRRDANDVNQERTASGEIRIQSDPKATPKRSQRDPKAFQTRPASAMKLSPQHPPGRSNRKALSFADEIARLVAEGYSCTAIRCALADAGVTVSKSTVQREVTRARARRQPSRRAPDASGTSSGPPARSPAPTSALVSAPAESTPRTGREIAEDFFRGRIDNPLVRARSNP